MGQSSTRKTSVPPLDFSQFLEAHRRTNLEKIKRPRKVKRNKFGNASPKSSLKKQEDNGNGKPPRQMVHGVRSEYMKNRYSDKNTAEGKALVAVMQAIEKDIGKPFDARQSLVMSLIRSKVVIIMQIGKYLESIAEIVDYEQGSVPHVVDKTFFHASASLRSALNELYSGKNAKQKGKKTYEEIVAKMNKDK